jgi:hypothetical protein
MIKSTMMEMLGAREISIFGKKILGNNLVSHVLCGAFLSQHNGGMSWSNKNTICFASDDTSNPSHTSGFGS